MRIESGLDSLVKGPALMVFVLAFATTTSLVLHLVKLNAPIGSGEGFYG